MLKKCISAVLMMFAMLAHADPAPSDVYVRSISYDIGVDEYWIHTTVSAVPWYNPSTNRLEYMRFGTGLSTSVSGGITYLDVTGLSTKLDTPTGTTSQYLRGDGSLATFPMVGKAVVGTTEKSGTFRTYKSATVSSGTAVFHLTSDGTSTGTALYTEVFQDSVQLIVNDSAASYQMSWAWSNSDKTLTVTTNKLTTANILTGVLGQGQGNGAVVRLTVEGR